MAFALQEATLNNFIDDGKIILPRYQRKLTWTQRQNFEFSLSVFKDFPLGVVVINLEEDDNGTFQKWLLDGRQRRNVLTEMQNPEKIYIWAKAAIGFKVNDTKERVRELFWEEVDKFLEPEEKEENGDDKPSFQDSESEEPASTEEDEEIEGEEENNTYNENISINGKKFVRGDVGRLLEIIYMIHPMRGKKNGLTRNFDFSKYLDGLDFIGDDGSVDSEELLLWIGYKKDRAEKTGNYPPDKGEFLKWLKQGTMLKAKSDQKLISEIERRWPEIIQILNILDVLSLQLNEGKIGYLVLQNADTRDAQKVFELINSSGTKLEAAEILSAKPSWNVKIDNVPTNVLEDVKKLYDQLGIKQQDVVKWDTIATSLQRIDLDYII